MKMNEEVDEILEKFNKNEETVEDVYKLKELADQGNTKAALNYGICLFVGHLIDEAKEEASKYFEKGLHQRKDRRAKRTSWLL